MSRPEFEDLEEFTDDRIIDAYQLYHDGRVSCEYKVIDIGHAGEYLNKSITDTFHLFYELDDELIIELYSEEYYDVQDEEEFFLTKRNILQNDENLKDCLLNAEFFHEVLPIQGCEKVLIVAGFECC